MGELHSPASLAEEAAAARAGHLEHAVQLYRNETELGSATAAFVAAGLRAGESAVVIGSMPRWNALLRNLGALDVDSRAAALGGQLRFFGARTVLGACMSRGIPDRLAFNESVGGVLAQARLPGSALRVCNDLSDVLWRDGAREAALALESFWTSLDVAPLALLCACPLDSLDAAAYEGGMQRVCAAHTHFVPAGDCGAFDAAVQRAIDETLEPRLVRMLQSLSVSQRPAAQMPAGQAVLFWLRAHMPRTADKVLARARREMADR